MLADIECTEKECVPQKHELDECTKRVAEGSDENCVEGLVHFHIFWLHVSVEEATAKNRASFNGYRRMFIILLLFCIFLLLIYNIRILPFNALCG